MLIYNLGMSTERNADSAKLRVVLFLHYVNRVPACDMAMHEKEIAIL